jgi:hypothetical protein
VVNLSAPIDRSSIKMEPVKIAKEMKFPLKMGRLARNAPTNNSIRSSSKVVERMSVKEKIMYSLKFSQRICLGAKFVNTELDQTLRRMSVF